MGRKFAFRVRYVFVAKEMNEVRVVPVEGQVYHSRMNNDF